MSIEIRSLTHYDEMLGVQQVQQAIWKFADSTGIYPPSLQAFADNGGMVLGAVDTQTGQMVGFLFGFLGRHWDGQIKLYSQTMGVLPRYRRAGIAYQLKCAQREWALAQGLKLVTWTYDPLEMPNARLNISKLGAIARRYKRNLYGENFGVINQGLPSDRFVAEWILERPAVLARLCGRHAPRFDEAEAVNEVEGRGVARRLVQYNGDATAPAVRVEVLNDMQATKAHDLALALDWRLKTRALFEAYFERDYAVTDFVSRGSGEERQNWYILTKLD